MHLDITMLEFHVLSIHIIMTLRIPDSPYPDHRQSLADHHHLRYLELSFHNWIYCISDTGSPIRNVNLPDNTPSSAGVSK